MQITPTLDRIVRNSVYKYWSKHLRYSTAIQVDDLIQDCWLRIAEKNMWNKHYIHKAIPWYLNWKFFSRGRFSRFVHITIADNAAQQYQYEEFRYNRLASLSNDEIEYLYQNINAVIAPGYRSELLKYLQGEPCQTGYRQKSVRNAVRILFKAFPTRAALLGPSKVAHYTPALRLRILQVVDGLWPANADECVFLKRQIEFLSDSEIAVFRKKAAHNEHAKIQLRKWRNGQKATKSGT